MGGRAQLLDLRYRRQGYELNVGYDPQTPGASIEAFHELHRQRYGFAMRRGRLKIVNLRVRMIAASEPYEPERRTLVRGRMAARLATPSAKFGSMDGFRPTRIYRRELLVPGDAIRGAGDDYRIHGGHAAAAGLRGARGCAGQPGDRCGRARRAEVRA
jgi:N-methylhydantoinase A/oxoprolinase/acetone carboxylase beta subunit